MSRNAQAVKVPPGKKVQIFNGATNILNGLNPKPQSELVLAEEIQLSISSNFSPVMGSNDIFKVGSLISSAFNVGTLGAYKQFGFQSWTGTNPISTTFTIDIHRVSNAYIDVWKPAQLLMRLPLPVEGDHGNLHAPGPSFLDVINDTAGTDIKIGGNKIVTFKKLNLLIGEFLYMNYVLIKRVEPTFSTEVDDTGCPVFCKLAVDVDTVYTGTANVIANMEVKNSRRNLK